MVAFLRFKWTHRRQYWDEAEEAVRKNLMVQHSRFVSSGNRQGATFNMEVPARDLHPPPSALCHCHPPTMCFKLNTINSKRHTS